MMPNQVNSDWTSWFPILRELVFLDHAGVAPISGPAAGALRDYADQAQTHGYVGAGWHTGIDRVKELAARLIHAESKDEIALVANTSTGLNMVANGLHWREGDNVVITDVEYPANRYPWQDLQRIGVELIEVSQEPDGRIEVDQVCDAVTDRTRIVAISHVQYASGFRIELRPISDLVHQAGGHLCVDAIQSLGAMPVDVQEEGIDFLAADGHKWLLAPEGCGVFYCRRDLIELLHPALVGWMNMEDHTNYGSYRLE
ncbi:MAG: aminotransferase class V-fold PLP-dependent enzyme, partial [Pirellulaceae bacterium]|nr:aminotransferase class V-fold PLP-dependent enzyme [Pirellulaceae bacterium]